MAHTPPCSAPEMGEVFVRSDDYLGRFEASVVARNVRGDDWRVHIMTDNGIIELTRSDFGNPAGYDSWRPARWCWDPKAFMFAPPNLVWDESAGEEGDWVERDEEDDAEVKDGNSLPDESAIPRPEAGEHHATWRARCRRKFPELDGEGGAELLGQVWEAAKARS